MWQLINFRFLKCQTLSLESFHLTHKAMFQKEIKWHYYFPTNCYLIFESNHKCKGVSISLPRDALDKKVQTCKFD